MIRPVEDLEIIPAEECAPDASDTIVIGIGNVLMQDDGVGSSVAGRLAESGGLACRVVDGGIGGVSLIGLMSGHDRIFIIDAVEMGREPGEVAVIEESRLADFAHVRLSSGHEMGFEQVLQIFRAAGFTSEVVLIGIQPSSIGPGRSLSRALEARITTIVDQIRLTIQKAIYNGGTRSFKVVPSAAINDVEFFRGLTEAQRERIAALAEEKQYKTNEVVFREYTPAEYLHIMLEGRAAVQVEVGNQKRTSVSTITPGLLFGWSAVVRPYQWTASAVCTEDSRVVRIHGAGLRKLMDEDPAMGYRIMEQISQIASGRLKDTRLQLINLIHWPKD